MGAAGGKGFVLALDRQDPEYGSSNAGIGEQDTGQRDEAHAGTFGEDQHVLHGGVRAGECQQLLDVAEEVRDLPGGQKDRWAMSKEWRLAISQETPTR